MRAILYNKACDCPSSELARKALTEARVDFESRSLESQPVDRDAALALARAARRFSSRPARASSCTMPTGSR
jgi:hypothetical protein